MTKNNFISNMRPDPPDFRDRMYQPILRALDGEFNAQPYADPAWTARVRNQEPTQACTGFALAAMVEALAYESWSDNEQRGNAPQSYSPFMLYYFARRYDEFRSNDADGGSTARAAMKAWHKHGACAYALWSSLKEEPTTAGQDWVSDGFKTPLGAYYRIDHQSIADMHAALTETGVIYVTAATHSGWDEPDKQGRIVNARDVEPGGGHAFLLVGYDEHGFWIQNSWGAEWGRKGFAHLAYTDWLERGWDAWVGQLGVYVTSHLDSLGHGLQFNRTAELRRKGKSNDTIKDPLPAGRAMLSANVEVRAQQINPYIVNLENNGTLSESGKFRTTPQDLKDLANFYLTQAVKDWKLNDNEPINVALYAHGGLVSETSAAGAAATWVSALYASKVFPVFFMWETGLLDTIGNILRELVTGERVAGKGIFDGLRDRVQNFFDDRLEGLVTGASTPIWEEIKENAERATTNPKGGLRLLAKELSQLDPKLIKRLRFHLIGHSAGAVFHAHLVPALIKAGLNVQGVYFMAPACRVELFETNVLPHFQQGRIEAFAQFHMSDVFELADNVASIYHRSLLYLVSNACERQKGLPLLGMERFVKDAAWFKPNPNPAKVRMWDFIASPTSPLPKDLTKRSISTTHGGFDNDDHTIRAVLERIKKTAA